MADADNYQLGFSQLHHDEMFDEGRRRVKANKSLSILGDQLGDLSGLRLLDIGCSTGFMTALYADRFAAVTGVDIDQPAVEFARRNNSAPNIDYQVADAMATELPADSFDVVTCTHIYEHVPDARRLIAEVNRVLRPGGVCLFAAGNRLALIEPHYHLPLLSVIPKPLGSRYLRALGKGEHYYETHLTYWQLTELVAAFERIDYTRRAIAEPDRFWATDLIRPGSRKQRLALHLADHAYWLMPTYLWLLRKPSDTSAGRIPSPGG